MTRRLKIQLVALFGIATAMYAANVESQLDDPFYEPACTQFGGNCGKVFKSEYSHILSAWGILPKGHPLDLSLAHAGMLQYACYFIAISVRGPWPMREELFLGAATGGAIFSCYLLYIIKFILLEFCIVCFTFHCCNFALLSLAVLEYRNPEHVKPKAKGP